VAAVAVVDEEARRFTVPGAAFDDLLRRSFRCGMASDLDMQDLAVGMTDRKEDIEGLEPDRPHTEEITGPDILRMSLEKLPPAWGGLSAIGPAHVLRYGASRGLKTEPRQLGLDPSLTPEAVL